MITFNKLGRLGLFGNQMFQYATLYSVAKKNGYDYGVPYANTGNMQFVNFFLPNCFKNLSAKDSSQIFNKNIKMENSFLYDESIFSIKDETDLVGYFQSEKYFDMYRNDLIKEFEFDKSIKEKSAKIRSTSSKPVISLHIRLGDYVQQPQNFEICNFEYYNKALNLIPEDCNIFIFSDDISLAKTILKDIKHNCFYPSTNNKYVDMCLMTMCDYHIIANSTFSWWGSWLSNSKKTIAPSKWFGPAPHMPKNWSDVYCKEWVII